MSNSNAVIQNPDGSFSIDMSGVESGREALPEGTYTISISEVKFNPASKKSGQPMFDWEFQIEDEEYKGRKLFMHTSLKKEALWKLQRTLAAFGIDAKENFNFNPTEVVGLQAMASVTQGEFENKVKNDIAELFPIGGTPSDPTKVSVQAPF